MTAGTAGPITVLTNHSFNLNFYVTGINAYVSDILYAIDGYGCSIVDMPGMLGQLIKSPVIVAPACESDLVYTITAALPGLSDTVTSQVFVHVEKTVEVPPPIIACNPLSVTTFSYEQRQTVAEDCHDLAAGRVCHLPCNVSLQFITPDRYSHKSFNFKSTFVLTDITCCHLGTHVPYVYILENLGDVSSDQGFMCLDRSIKPKALPCSPDCYSLYLQFDKDIVSDSVMQLVTGAHLQMNTSDHQIHIIDKQTEFNMLDDSALEMRRSGPLTYFVSVPPTVLKPGTSTTFTIDVTHECPHSSDTPPFLVDPLSTIINFCFSFTH